MRSSPGTKLMSADGVRLVLRFLAVLAVITGMVVLTWSIVDLLLVVITTPGLPASGGDYSLAHTLHSLVLVAWGTITYRKSGWLARHIAT